MFQEWLTRPDRPTGILCSDDTEAEALYCSAMDMGLKIPDDLAIIGFGVPGREGLFRRRLTSIKMNGFELGRKALKK